MSACLKEDKMYNQHSIQMGNADMYIKHNPLTFDQVNEWIAYDGATGVFTWRKALGRRIKAGDEAGVVKSTKAANSEGVARQYRYIGLMHYQTPAARIAWLLTHGEWPKGNLLFRDGDPLNLRIDNLKEGDFPAVISIENGARRYKMSREAQRHYGLKRYYDLSLATYNVMLAAQGGVCAICKGTENYVPKGATEPKPLSVDHNHETGEIRGLLCSNCNYVVGHCKENRNVLLEAIKYLDKYAGTAPAVAKLTIVPTEDQA